jgi:hypothetical protein
MKIIGIAGQAQNGKDSISDRLALKLNSSQKNWQRMAFASAVKKVFCETFNVDLEFIEKWKTIAENPPGFDCTVRQSLQFIGDGFRKIKSSVWLDLAFRDKQVSTIVSDVRYINEFSRIKNEGGLNILVVRPNKINYDSNDSEAQIRSYSNYLLSRFRNEKSGVVNLNNIDWAESRKLVFQPPEHIEMFDLFVCNCGTKDDLYNLVDHHIVPFCENFVFKN